MKTLSRCVAVFAAVLLITEVSNSSAVRAQFPGPITPPYPVVNRDIEVQRVWMDENNQLPVSPNGMAGNVVGFQCFQRARGADCYIAVQRRY
jgi:hypothetical protein